MRAVLRVWWTLFTAVPLQRNFGCVGGALFGLAAVVGLFLREWFWLRLGYTALVRVCRVSGAVHGSRVVPLVVCSAHVPTAAALSAAHADRCELGALRAARIVGRDPGRADSLSRTCVCSQPRVPLRSRSAL